MNPTELHHLQKAEILRPPKWKTSATWVCRDNKIYDQNHSLGTNGKWPVFIQCFTGRFTRLGTGTKWLVATEQTHHSPKTPSIGYQREQRFIFSVIFLCIWELPDQSGRHLILGFPRLPYLTEYISFPVQVWRQSCIYNVGISKQNFFFFYNFLLSSQHCTKIAFQKNYFLLSVYLIACTFSLLLE